MPPAFFIGLRGSDRFQGKGVAVTAVVVVLVAVAAGVVLHRVLRGPDWAPLSEGTAPTPRPSPSAWEMDAPAAPSFPTREDGALYERGRRLLAGGDAKGALGPLTEAARRLPQNPAVMRDYGLALVRTGNEDRGLFTLEHASRLAPGIASYRLDLIHALLAAGRREPAARELRELLARDPSNLTAAELLASLGDGPAGGVASPGAATGSVDLGGAAGVRGSARPGGGGATFTNEDLDRRRAAPPSAARSPDAVAPDAPSSPALIAPPSPSA